eukprot:6204825-Pleurochrysis_carterae.AAC.2
MPSKVFSCSGVHEFMYYCKYLKYFYSSRAIRLHCSLPSRPVCFARDASTRAGMALGHGNSESSGAPFARCTRMFCDAAVQTDESYLGQPSNKEVLRNRLKYQKRKAKEEHLMHAQFAVRQAQKLLQPQQPREEPVAAVVVPVRATAVPLVTSIDCSSAGCMGPMAARLVPTVGGGFKVKQLRPVSEQELRMNVTYIAKEINALCSNVTRGRTASSLDPSACPTSYVPEYTTSLKDHVWRKELLMTQDIWSGPSSPLGPYFTIDPTHRGVQRYSFTFPDTQLQINWCAVFVPQEEQASIAKLHTEAALLLANGSVGDRDETATEA